MDIGIGFPSYVPDTSGKDLITWAQHSEERGFSSLGTIDRLVYPIYSPLIALAAAAAVTQRIRLVTTVLLSPLHNGAILAKQAASLDALAGGRFVLGIGVGSREDDFTAAGVDFHQRGKIADDQLAEMRRIWSGSPSQGEGIVPPMQRQGPVQRQGPEVLVGGYSPAAVQRVTRYGDGFISGGIPAHMAANTFSTIHDAWQKANRPGKPRIVACAYVALGDDIVERSRQAITRYYGQGFGAQVIQGLLTSPEAINEATTEFEKAGADEVILWPQVADLSLVDAVAAAVGK